MCHRKQKKPARRQQKIHNLFSHINHRMTVILSLAFFLCMSLSMLLIGLSMALLYHFDIISHFRPFVALLIFAIISLIIGTILSHRTSTHVFRSIMDVINATQEVAKGNFHVKLEETQRFDESQCLAHNFNIMTQELANTEIFRNDFVRNVSHEFKTPLSAIEGYATLLQNPSLSPEKRDFYIRKILHNSKRLSSLTDQILALSKLEHREIDTNMTCFSLDEQIREVILLFEDIWTKKDLDLTIDLDTTDYYGNYELLAQVWQNLIGNAVKFVDDKGMICIHATRTAKDIIVHIADNGIGMDEDTCRHIFEKFYQGDTTHHTEGNGLGLTLVKRIVELHNGTIQVQSRPGIGSTFTVTLPYPSAPPAYGSAS